MGQIKGQRDLRILSLRRCPMCGHDLIAGPRGGAAQNFYCPERNSCRLGFNLTFVAVRRGRSDLVFAERLGEIDDERFRLYAEGDGR